MELKKELRLGNYINDVGEDGGIYQVEEICTL